MKNKRVDLDSPRERFLGFWPRRKQAQIFCVLNIIWLFLCCGSWYWVPDIYVGNWFPFTRIWGYILSAVGAILWSTYCRKFWSANEQEKLDDESGRFEKKEGAC